MTLQADTQLKSARGCFEAAQDLLAPAEACTMPLCCCVPANTERRTELTAL